VTLIWRALSAALGAPKLARRWTPGLNPRRCWSCLREAHSGVSAVCQCFDRDFRWPMRRTEEWRSDATDDDLTVKEVSKSVKLSASKLSA
jgi:hypothetical protein